MNLAEQLETPRRVELPPALEEFLKSFSDLVSTVEESVKQFLEAFKEAFRKFTKSSSRKVSLALSIKPLNLKATETGTPPSSLTFIRSNFQLSPPTRSGLNLRSSGYRKELTAIT